MEFGRVLVVGIILWTTMAEARVLNDEALLNSYLLNSSEYSPKVRPVVNSIDVVTVWIGINLNKINALDDKDQILSWTGFLEVLWENPLLTWTPSNYGNVAETLLTNSDVWIPDISLVERTNDDYDLSSPTSFRVEVNSTGHITWHPGGTFGVPCEMELTYFPFDKQTCTFTIRSWTMHEEMLRIGVLHDTIHLDNLQPNGEWYVYSSSLTTRNLTLEGAHAWDVLVASITLHRKPAYFVMNILIPCGAISFLLLLMFLLPVDCGEKISFGVTVVLAFSVVQLLISDNMPISSDSTSIIAIYVTILLSLAVCSMCVTAIVLNIHHQPPSKPMPTWMRKLVFNYLARVCCMFDPVMAVTPGTNVEPLDRRSITNLSRLSLKNSTETSNNTNSQTNNKKSDLEVYVSKIHELVEKIVELKEEKNKEDFSELYRKAATVLDRFFLIVFLLLTTVIGVVCLTVVASNN